VRSEGNWREGHPLVWNLCYGLFALRKVRDEAHDFVTEIFGPEDRVDGSIWSVKKVRISINQSPYTDTRDVELGPEQCLMQVLYRLDVVLYLGYSAFWGFRLIHRCWGLDALRTSVSSVKLLIYAVSILISVLSREMVDMHKSLVSSIGSLWASRLNFSVWFSPQLSCSFEYEQG